MFARNRWISGFLVGLLGFWAVGFVSVEPSAAQNRRTDHAKVMESLELFTRVFEKINTYYVDEDVDPEELVKKAIEGMLAELDPHSQFLDTRQYDDLMTSTQGSFGGLGIEISVRDKYPTVVSPIEGTPAYRQGIQGGDRIVEIEGEDTFGWPIARAISKLRGPKGSEVNFKISREGTEDRVEFSIVRDIIEIESVRYSFRIGDIGYVRVVNFAQDTAEELQNRLVELEAQGIKGLILDLRYNPGGLLRAARDVGQLFLDSGKKIVYTRGRTPRQNSDYYSTTPSPKVHAKDYPIVVLINEGSASASEIVAGALQDWDAALIVGETSFGKGSVQTVYPLSETEALKLTTAKYYTPSGRCIHKDPRGDKEEGEDGESSDISLEKDSEEEAPGETTFTTIGGRPVLSGGGITPDIRISQPNLTKYAVNLERRNLFFKFAIKYVANHTGIEDVEVSPTMIDDFKALIESDYIDQKLDEEYVFDSEGFEKNQEYVDRSIRREMTRRLSGSKAAYMVQIEGDEQLKRALDLFARGKTVKELYAVTAEDIVPLSTEDWKRLLNGN